MILMQSPWVASTSGPLLGSELHSPLSDTDHPHHEEPTNPSVIPAQAGIQRQTATHASLDALDPRLRGDDKAQEGAKNLIDLALPALRFSYPEDRSFTLLLRFSSRTRGAG